MVPSSFSTWWRALSGRASRAFLVATSVMVMPACYDQVLIPAFETDGRLNMSNDEEALNDRVGHPDEDVPIAPTSPAAAGLAAVGPARAPSSIQLTLVGEIAPPTVNGQVVQATSVWATRNDKAIVSYNVRGSSAVGALDFFTRLTNRRPRLRSSVTFTDADANAVFTDGNRAYSATASTDASFAWPAVMERIRIRNDRFRVDPGNMRLPLTSFAATSAMATDNAVYVTSGDGGGVFAFDVGDMSLLGEFALDDARWVAWDEDNRRVVVLQGTPGRLTVFAEDAFPMIPLATFLVPGVDVPESKSTVEVAGGKAFVAAGPEGVQVVCLDNGQVVGSVPRPDPGSLGLDPSVVVTNAVTVDDDVMFISNGEAGVYAAAVSVGRASFPLNVTILRSTDSTAVPRRTETPRPARRSPAYRFSLGGIPPRRVPDASTSSILT